MIDGPHHPDLSPHGGEGTKPGPVDAAAFTEPDALARDDRQTSLASASDTSAKPLAKILTRRAIDLFAISLVLIVGLTAGREIVTWWRAADAPQAAAPADPQTAWSDRPLEIHFGESASYQRVPFRGSVAAAVAELIQQLKACIESAEPLSPTTDEEQAWLEKLHELTPAETSDSGAKFYVVPSMFPTAAATAANSKPERLAGWAMAMPAGEETWTLFVFSSSQPAAPTPLAAIRLPGGASRLFGWNDERNQGVLAFQGKGQLSAWLAHFDNELGPRLSGNEARQGRWNHDGRQIDIQFSAAGEEITGLLWMTTPSSGQNTTR